MANEFKIKKGLIVTGASGGTVVDIQGSQGQLFSVTDNLSGSIFAVSDISGVPILDVNSSGAVNIDGTLIGSSTAYFSGAITTNLSSEGTYFTGGSGGLRQLSITSGTNTSAHALHTFNIGSSNGKYEFDVNGTTQLSLNSSNATFAGDVTISTSAFSQLDIITSRSGATDNIGGVQFYKSSTLKGQIFGVNDGKVKIATNGSTVALTLDESQNATFAGKATSLATAASDGSTTLTTKSYVDGLVTGVPVYKGTWAAGTTGVTSAAINGTTITLTAAPTETIAVGDVVTADGIIAATTVTAVASQTSVTVSATVVIATGITVTFSPEGGYPDLTLAAAKVLGNYYIVSTAGSAAPNGSGVEPDSWAVGDWCIFSDVTPGAGTDLWQRIDNSSVISGAGTGKTIPLWEGETNAVSETLGNAPITVSGTTTIFGGSVGIGSSPSDKLTVSGSGNFGIKIDNSSNTSSDYSVNKIDSR